MEKLACALLFGIGLVCAACTGASQSPSAPAAVAARTTPTASGAKEHAHMGARPPAFSLESAVPGRGKVTLVSGKVMLVQFWATWNEPSKRALSQLQRLHETYESRGFDVLAISVDDRESGCAERAGACSQQANLIAETARGWGATFPVAWDEEHKVTNTWRLGAMPTTYLIDRNGVIVNEHRGWHQGVDAELEREIAQIL